MFKVEAIVREERMEDVKDALREIDVRGITVSQVMGCSTPLGFKHHVCGSETTLDMLPKAKFEIVVSNKDWAEKTVDAIVRADRGIGAKWAYEPGSVEDDHLSTSVVTDAL